MTNRETVLNKYDLDDVILLSSGVSELSRIAYQNSIIPIPVYTGCLCFLFVCLFAGYFFAT
jgi:hypothetical protein